jgi:NADPH2:quinone reductase
MQAFIVFPWPRNTALLTAIDCRSTSVEQYVAARTEGQSLEIVYVTVGGAKLNASFNAV